MEGLPSDPILLGDCEALLPAFPAQSVDLIVTSPPYADSRRGTYGGIHPDETLKCAPESCPATMCRSLKLNLEMESGH